MPAEEPRARGGVDLEANPMGGGVEENASAEEAAKEERNLCAEPKPSAAGWQWRFRSGSAVRWSAIVLAIAETCCPVAVRRYRCAK